MSKQLKAAFAKWRLQGLKIDLQEIYCIDDKEKVMKATISRRRITSEYDRAMHVIYLARSDGSPKKVIHFNETFQNVSLENYMKKYDTRVTDLYKFNG